MTDVMSEVDPNARGRHNQPCGPAGRRPPPDWPPVPSRSPSACWSRRSSTSFPRSSVGSEVIDRVPKWLKNLAIDLFGTNDKTALRVGIVTILAIASATFGHLARRRFPVGVVGFAAFAVIGVAAALHRPNQPGRAAVAPIVGAFAGIAVLALVLDAASARRGSGGSRIPPEGPRRFLTATGRLGREPWSLSAPLARSPASGWKRPSTRPPRSSHPRPPPPAIPLPARRQNAGQRGRPRRQPERGCRTRRGHPVHHPEQRLLPHRYGAVDPDRRPCLVEGVGRRDGRQATVAQLRRSARPPAG